MGRSEVMHYCRVWRNLTGRTLQIQGVNLNIAQALLFRNVNNGTVVFRINHRIYHTFHIYLTVYYLGHIHRPPIILIRAQSKLYRTGKVHTGICQVIRNFKSRCRETVCINTIIGISNDFRTFRRYGEAHNPQFCQVDRIVHIQCYGTFVLVDSCRRSTFRRIALSFHFECRNLRFFNGIRNIVFYFATMQCQQA